MAYSISPAARTALRRALREHPGFPSLPQSIMGPGKKYARDLDNRELLAALDYLGVNADQIISASVLIDQLPDPDDIEAEATPMLPDDPVIADAVADAVETEVQAIRSLIVTGGFGALDDRLRALVSEARKPPVEIRVEVPVPGLTVTGASAAPIHAAKPTGRRETWRALFDVRGQLAKEDIALWDGSHPDTPKVNPEYIWPQPQTAVALSQLKRGRNVFLYGPAGTGKTDWPQQLAAKLGRPFCVISCDNGTEGATLIGMTVPNANGGVSWQDGQLTRAIQTPGCVICLDEPSTARAGALMTFQNVLQYRQLYIQETGRRVQVAPGVLFVAADNTNGTGGGARRGYVDTNKLNAAFLDRFGPRIPFDYLSRDKERGVLVAYTGCTVELADLLISAAAVTRAAADDQTLSHGIGLRRLISWAELLIDGIDAETAFRCAVLNCASEQDVESLREQCLLAYDKDAVALALNPPPPVVTMPVPGGATVGVDPAVSNPTVGGREAAREFPTYTTR